MRIAIVSDIHGNRTAFEAVLHDLRSAAPDLILHGGDLADSGASPTHIIDYLRDLRWPGVYGNTDEMLVDPQSLTDFAATLPQLAPMWTAIADMAAWTRAELGPDRLAWLSHLPPTYMEGPLALLHASPDNPWKVPADSDLEALGKPIAVYGHTHRPFVKSYVANSGSVGQPLDGDPRAAYLLLDNGLATIRRVAYDVEKEITALRQSALPHRDWMIRTLQTATPQQP